MTLVGIGIFTFGKMQLKSVGMVLTKFGVTAVLLTNTMLDMKKWFAQLTGQ